MWLTEHDRVEERRAQEQLPPTLAKPGVRLGQEAHVPVSSETVFHIDEFSE